MVMAPSLGYVLARMRLETGSVWPAVALHVAWNVTIQAGFQPLAAGASSQVWVGESGILTALVLIIVGSDLLAWAMDDPPRAPEARERPWATGGRRSPPERALNRPLWIAVRMNKGSAIRDYPPRKER
jgi:hypothetical protein